MKNYIGGLFKSRQDAESARTALQANGLRPETMDLLQCTHRKEAVILDKNPSIKSIGRGALTGVIVLGGIGGLIGLLVGLGIIQVPALAPGTGQALPFQITWQFVFSSTLAGILLGAWTGAILGAAIRLAMPQYRKVEAQQPANKGDLMLAVQTDDPGKGTKARSILKEHGAFRLEEFKEQWDPEVWSLFNEETPQVR